MSSVESFTMDSSSSQDDENDLPNNKLDFLIFPSDMLDERASMDQSRRWEQASAEALEEKVYCKFYHQLNTTSEAQLFDENAEYDFYSGIVFRVQTRNIGLEITTMELSLKEDWKENSAPVKVFTKLGEYNQTGNIFAHPTSSWEEVTVDKAVVVAAERKSNIIPVEQFQPIVMEPKESRWIYVAILSSDAPLMKAATSLGADLDDTYAKNNELITHIGYAVTGSEYFGETIEDRPFDGIIHYQTKLPCEDQRDSFSINLPYFTDQVDPAAIVVSLSGSAVNEAVRRAMSRDANLIRMQNFGGLEFQGTSTETNVVPHEGPCPFEWPECSKLIVTVRFGYNDQLDPGMAQYEVMKYATDYNISMAPFQLGYVGKMPLSLDYYITLVGAPKSYDFDKIQEAYFGAQTAKFLAAMTGEDILAAGLVPSRRNTPSATSNPAASNGNGGSDGNGSTRKLRDNEHRGLQSTSAKVHASIYGAYDAWPVPQHPHSVRGVDSLATVELLQTAFDDHGAVYAQYLKEGLVMPGPIHEEKRSDFFAGVTGTDAELDENSLWFPTSAPTQAPTIDPNAEEEVIGIPKSTMKILAILMLIFGFLLLLFALYWEYQHRKEEKEKLKRNARAAQRKVDKLRAEQYRRVAERKRQIQGRKRDDESASEDVSLDVSLDASITDPMIT